MPVRGRVRGHGRGVVIIGGREPAIAGNDLNGEFHREATDAPRAKSRVRLFSGSFRTSFEDESAARAAARDARSVGFAVEVEASVDGGWLTLSRRRQPFPQHDADRYAGRLRNIAASHGGTYERYDDETA
jgi:hypothetical protein